MIDCADLPCLNCIQWKEGYIYHSPCYPSCRKEGGGRWHTLLSTKERQKKSKHHKKYRNLEKVWINLTSFKSLLNSALYIYIFFPLYLYSRFLNVHIHQEQVDLHLTNLFLSPQVFRKKLFPKSSRNPTVQ